MTLEREMVRHDRINSVGRVVVVVSGEGFREVNTSKQPTKRELHVIHNLTYNVGTVIITLQEGP